MTVHFIPCDTWAATSCGGGHESGRIRGGMQESKGWEVGEKIVGTGGSKKH